MNRPFRAGRLARWLREPSDEATLLGLRDDDRAELLWQASQRFDRGLIDDARRLFLLAARLWPRSADPLIGSGACDQAAGDLTAAVVRYDLALALRPGDPFALVNRAECCLMLGDIDEARRSLALIPAETADRAGLALRDRITLLRDRAEPQPGSDGTTATGDDGGLGMLH